MAYENHWLPGFNFNVEEWNAKGQAYETLAICRTLALARYLRGGNDWRPYSLREVAGRACAIRLRHPPRSAVQRVGRAGHAGGLSHGSQVQIRPE
jgi:hypothetical protein